MRTRWGAPFLLLLSFQLLSSVARARCTKDVECKGERICSNGVCSAPLPAPARTSEPRAAGLTPPAPEPTMYRRRTGLLVTGIVMSSVGTGALIGALAVGVVKATCDRDFEDMHRTDALPGSAADASDDCTSYDGPLLLLTAGGLVLAGAGVPLMIIGAKKVPVHTARARLVPWLGPRSGGLALRLAL
jgi:hypothetical protein